MVIQNAFPPMKLQCQSRRVKQEGRKYLRVPVYDLRIGVVVGADLGEGV